MKALPIFVGNQKVMTKDIMEVYSPFDQRQVGAVCLAGEAEVEAAISKAQQAFSQLKALSAYRRSQILKQIAQGVAQRAEELASTISLEAGKPIKFSRIEVNRCIDLFEFAAEEVKRFGGELVPVDLDKLSERRLGIYKRFPIGPVLCITPFNFPLNLVAHKVAPALAVGNPVIIRPSSATPLTALLLGEIMAETELPEGSFSILPCSTSLAEKMVRDDRLAMLTFTGSPQVGWHLKSIAGRKRVTLELGGNAGLIVDSLRLKDFLLERAIIGAFYQAGQVCISVQRIFVKRELFDEFLESFVTKAKQTPVGDPLNEETVVGPLISQQAADRVENWITEALNGGARLCCGGQREGNLIWPTVLTNTQPQMKVNALEVFGPVVTVEPYDDFKKAVAAVNDSPYGLQAGVFTDDLSQAFYAYEMLEVGGVIINDVPTYRADPMPYGGVKLSGIGKEGIKYAMQEMTEGHIMVVKWD